MSDYIAIEHDAETDETVERVMTQDEIDALMATFIGFNESVTVDTDAGEPPIIETALNPLPKDGEL